MVKETLLNAESLLKQPHDFSKSDMFSGAEPTTENNDGSFPTVFRIRPLLWSEIANKLNPSEVTEVRRILGSQLIDQNEELHREVLALAEILQDLQQQNELLMRRRQEKLALQNTSARQLLEQQIKLFVETLQNRKAIPIDAILQSDREKRVLEFLRSPEKSRQIPSLQSPARPIAPGFDLQLRPATRDDRRPFTAEPKSARTQRPATALSISSAPEILQLDAVSLDIINSAARSIQEALKMEALELKEDIEFLHCCLEDEAEERNAIDHIPDLKDMSALRSKLERVVLSQEDSEMLKVSMNDLRKVGALEPLKPEGGSSTRVSAPPEILTLEAEPIPEILQKSSERRRSSVNRIRNTVMDARDEDFLS